MKILKTNSLLGEGLSYLNKRQCIIAFDILDRKAYFIDPCSNWSLTVVNIPFRGSCAMEMPDGSVIIAGDHALYHTYDFNTFEVVYQHDFPADVRMNDGRGDHLGRFWYSSMAMNGDRAVGEVFCYDPQTQLCRVMITGLTIPNAICFDQARNRGYIADSSSGLISCFDLAVEPPLLRPFVDLSSKFVVPDGAIVDSAGCLWNAQWGGGQLVRYCPEGYFLDAVDVPATQVTCPLLHNNSLVATSARMGLDEVALDLQPEAGNIFIIPL
jgi:L-arabinonolactonase